MKSVERLTVKCQGWQEKQWTTNVLHVDTKPVCSPALELSGVFSGSPYGLSRCWSETNTLRVISVAKNQLIQNQQKLQFAVLNCGKPHAKLQRNERNTGKKGFPSGSNGKESAGNAGDPALILWKGEKESGKAIVNKQSTEGMGVWNMVVFSFVWLW